MKRIEISDELHVTIKALDNAWPTILASAVANLKKTGFLPSRSDMSSILRYHAGTAGRKSPAVVAWMAIRFDAVDYLGLLEYIERFHNKAEDIANGLEGLGAVQPGAEGSGGNGEEAVEVPQREGGV